MKNETPFSPDSAILEKIGFAFSCFDTFTIFMEISVDSERYHEYTKRFLLACMDELSSGSKEEDYVRMGQENIYSLFNNCLQRGENEQPQA